MNDLETLAHAWTVETVDLTARVAAAIGATPPDEIAELRDEIRALRLEMAELRRALTPVAGSRRLAPYSPVESLVRLS